MSSTPPSADQIADELSIKTSIKDWEIYVVDSHSLIYQVFHALPDMTSPRGESVGAVYGFVRDLLYLLEEKRPDALICAFDLPGPTFRHDLYDEYKANRSEMPSALISQIPKIREILEAMSVPILAAPGFEADDILATLARVCTENQANCYMVTGDKDCRQLINDRVAIYNIRKDLFFDEEAVVEAWGIRADQVVDFQALVGDKVDNVPGVPLIGPKIAGELLTTYGTLERVLDNASEVKGKKRSQNLIAFRDQALLSRELVKLCQQAPVSPDWSASQVGGFDHEKLGQLFTGYGFRTFAERVAKLDGAENAVEAVDWEMESTTVDTSEKLEMLVAQLTQHVSEHVSEPDSEQPLISVDTETTSVNPRWAELVGISLAWKTGQAYYLPVRGPEGDTTLDLQETLEALRPFLENPAVGKVGQNLKYDMIVFRNVGIEVQGVVFDSMVASYLLDAGERSHGLDDLAKRYLNHTNIKIDTLIGRGKNQKRMDEVPVADVATYAAEDADVPLRLQPLLQARLDQDELTELNESLEVPLIPVLVELEFNGIQVDRERLAELSTRFGKRLEELEVEIEELAGHPLNIASPKQLGKVLFEELGLRVVKKTKTGPSTDASVLEELADDHPLPAKIIEYRQYSKLKNTYVDTLPELIHPTTNRVHASFNQVVAATGRLSSSDPNLQNIPIRTEEGRAIRSAFTAGEPGWQLLAADYSQIELRVLAHISEDPAMCEAFANDADIHTLVASQVYGVDAEDVTSEMRRGAKAVNFGVIYGQSPFGLAKSLKIGTDEAAEFIDNYFDKYHGVEQFIVRTLEECRQQGYVKTILGRRRAIEGVRGMPAQENLFDTPARRLLNMPERTAVNTVIQGSAADLIKMAMLNLHKKMGERSLKARMLLQIHDELVFEVARDDVDALATLVRDEMTQVMKLSVPLKVDVKWGKNWADCEPWDE